MKLKLVFVIIQWRIQKIQKNIHLKIGKTLFRKNNKYHRLFIQIKQ
jgi:hypothetical protein